MSGAGAFIATLIVTTQVFAQAMVTGLLTGTLEQNQVFRTMEVAADLIGKANSALSTGN